MGEEVIIKSLRLCASEESRCVVCEYRHHKGCIAQLQRDAADALERLEATNKTLMRLMRQQAAELERRDRLLKEQEAAIQTALDVAEERRQAAAYASELLKNDMASRLSILEKNEHTSSAFTLALMAVQKTLAEFTDGLFKEVLGATAELKQVP